MSNSSLASMFIPAKWYTKGRDGRHIEMITIHHMACIYSAEQCGKSFQGTKKASSHYGVGVYGEIGQYVDECNTAWANANWDSNCKAVTIETSNDEVGGEWHVSDTTLRSLIKLVADIAKRNNLGKLVRGKNLTWHSMYAATACVPVETEVLTRNGWKKIKDIEIGEEIASANLEDLSISFEEVYDKVPIKTQDTYTCSELTATKDHRMIYSIQSSKDYYRIDSYNNLLNSSNNIYIPLAGNNTFKGIDLSDDMIKFYVAIQADGHYMKEGEIYTGLEFHLKKERKINRIKSILENLKFPYTISNKSDGSVSIRIWNYDGINIVNDICEKWLNNKCFTWDFIYMNKEQSKIFLDEILKWDGCVNANKYTSSNLINLDIVNAIASINNIGSRVVGNDVLFRDVAHTVLSDDVKRNKGKQLTEVSCVSVKTGIILIRQNGKTFIVGNCPGKYLLSKIDYIIAEANKINEYEEPKKEEEFEVAKVYKNGSTIEKVYADTNLTKQVGSLDKYEQCECLAIVNGRYLVKYKVNGTNNYKCGFCKYSGGVK